MFDGGFDNLEQVLDLVDMRNIKIKIRYKGTSYCGWQSQKNGVAVQDVIERAIESIGGGKVKLVGSGRTDAGVHALGQAANFTTDLLMPAGRLPMALNANLPDDIVVYDAEDVDPGFNAQFNAAGKRYLYCIWNSRFRPGLFDEYCYHYPFPLDTIKMKETVKVFIGTHDFKNFMSTGSNVKSTVRTIWGIKLIIKDELIFIDVRGNGFLYNMVRRIAGCLVDVGRGNLDISAVKDLVYNIGELDKYVTLPAKGLSLVEVYY